MKAILAILLIVILLVPMRASATSASPPNVVGRSSGFDSAAGTSHSISLASGSGPDSYLMVWLVMATATAEIPPVGWTIALNVTTGGTAYRTIILLRAVDGTEGSTITVRSVVSTKIAWVTYRVANVAAVTIPTHTSGNSASPQGPNNAMPSPDYYLFVAPISRNSNAACIGFPSKYTSILSATTASTNLTGVCSSEYAAQTTSEQPTPYTLSVSAGWAAETVGFVPMPIPSTTDNTALILALTCMFVAWGLAVVLRGIVFVISGFLGIIIILAFFASFDWPIALGLIVINAILMLIGVSELME